MQNTNYCRYSAIAPATVQTMVEEVHAKEDSLGERHAGPIGTNPLSDNASHPKSRDVESGL
eukprot:4478379-Pyramimonas_sp.AAC.1